MRWLNRIEFKLGAVIAALLLLVILLMGFTIDRMFTTFYHKQAGEDLDELASHFAGMAQTHENGSEEMIHLFAEFSDVSISMVDIQGNRTAELGSLRVEDDGFITREALQLLERGQSTRSEFASQAGVRYFVSAHPIAGGEHTSSAIFVLSSMRSMDESLQRVRLLIILSAAGAFILAIGFSYVVSHQMSRPLIQMEQAARTIAKGKLEIRLPARSQDEIGTLAAAINDLARDLQHYRDTRQEFFANVSHELRTPITYLEGYAKVIHDGLYETEEEKLQYLSIIRQESLRLSRLIHDLFELSKMEEGKFSLSPDWLDLPRLVESCVGKAQLAARDKGLELTWSMSVSVPGEPAPVYYDSLRLEQVIQNLLDNAIRYTEQGAVRVHISSDPDGYRIAVEDSGIGIPADELPYLFERFYRVEKSRSRDYGGTGLGLAISRKLVELQGGTLEAASALGKGSRFTVFLPYESGSAGQHP
ncbi:MAG: transcriptional regulator [Paenibacillaceae bacterium]|jgi:signal transduction histidine kinase|nr:transcriptional regulator [Paenibacillaceae bacterium]